MSTYCDFDGTYRSLISDRPPFKITCLVTCAGEALPLGALVITVAIPIALAVAIDIAIALAITIAILIALAVTIAITVAIAVALAIGLAISTLPPWPTATVGWQESRNTSIEEQEDLPDPSNPFVFAPITLSEATCRAFVDIDVLDFSAGFASEVSLTYLERAGMSACVIGLHCSCHLPDFSVTGLTTRSGPVPIDYLFGSCKKAIIIEEGTTAVLPRHPALVAELCPATTSSTRSIR